MAKITLYKDSGFKGEELKLENSVLDLKERGFNDNISSARVEHGTWQIYSDNSYQGASVTLSPFGGPDGDGNYPTALFMGGRGDYFSSIKLVHG